MGMLSVITGIVFVLLLLSLLATTVMELLATVSLRGKNLEEAPRNMLAGTDADEKILGWAVTAMAVSPGVPFWFDLLRKIANLRSSGNTPGE